MSDTLPSQSLRLIGYFSASAVTTQNYDVDDIPAGLLSHVIYAFANVTAMGDCESVDPAGDAANFSQLLELKAEYPQLMVLISVGGASHSTNFSTVCDDKTKRQHFAESCVQFMTQNGFDGVDIDWEFPAAADSKNFTTLVHELRNQLDVQGEADGYYLPSYTRSWDTEALVPWLYNAGTGIMISYEDPESPTSKVNYVLSNQLGGVMIWELGADDEEGTLVNAVASALP